MKQIQVQVRLPEELVRELDLLIKNKVVKSRSEAIKMLIWLYKEKRKTEKFLKMLIKRSKEAREKPKKFLIRFEDIKV